MRIGLIDVDGHKFPNLALMRISQYHKSIGDTVEWWNGLLHYDKVYMSKVFSDAYSKDIEVCINADEVYRGGTGYAIALNDGVEVYDKAKDQPLPDYIEKMPPDYSIYPQYDFAISMTTRGCPRGCPFCHVAAKEGRCSHKVADVKDFWNGQKRIEVLDPNITACKDRFDLYEQYAETKANIVFSQGLDIRLITPRDVEYLNKMKCKEVHFAWDNPNDDLTEQFKMFKEMTAIRDTTRNVPVYVLTNYNSTMEENLHRIYTLKELGFRPYVMVYDKPHAPKEIKQLQRWCNNMWIFKTCDKFEDYRRKG